MPLILNSTHLKIIAIITMLIDHIGMFFFPSNWIIRIVGRLAFPIFCFTIVEGYYHTKNIRKYIERLLIFALISEIPYNIMHYNKILCFDEQNVIFTLAIGLLLIYACDHTKDIYMRLLYIAIALAWAHLIQCEYTSFGILMIFGFYIFRDKTLFNIIWQFLVPIAYVLIDQGGNIKYTQLAAPLALIPIYLYNGEKGKGLKYFFYVFYPLHFVVLYIIKLYVSGGIKIG